VPVIGIAKPLIGEEEKQAVLETLNSGMLAQGPRVEAFEEAFAGMCEVQHAVATSSGSTALHVALLAHGIGSGDEVITTSFTFVATATSILLAGARPVFVDIEPVTFNLDPAQIEAAITARTKALMPVHLFGLIADMDPIRALAEKHDLAVIEDACQAHGAIYHGTRAGAFGMGAFSFYPTKNMICGEGGMITTDDPYLADKCRTIRQHGMRRRYYHDELGYHYRMTDIHAAIGLAQLQKLETHNAAWIANAAYLTQNLEGVIAPACPEGCRHVYHQYTVRVPACRRDALQAHLQAQGIGSGIYYPVPVHQQTYFVEALGYDVRLPEAERAAGEVLSLPVHPAVQRDDLDTIVSGVNGFMGGQHG
jgi:dTDP-4-amino-4,6-dideoxygalactose transaminase